MNSNEKRNRILGVLFGGAVGDAIGLHTEFLTAKNAIQFYGNHPTFTLPPTNMLLDQHRTKWFPGEWTDDTDQMLLILLAWLRNARPGPTVSVCDFANRLRIWTSQGLMCLNKLPVDIGQTVGTVVFDDDFLEKPVEVANKVWEHSNRYLAANGAVMRTSICGLVSNNVDEVIQFSFQMASVTHADRRCLISCGIISGLIASLVNGRQYNQTLIEDIISTTITAVDTFQAWTPASNTDPFMEGPEKYCFVDDLVQLKVDDGSKIGYTYLCLGTALWALKKVVNGQSYKDVITELTMAGGDADTNCAVAGALIGSYLGYKELPEDWVSGLANGDWLMSKGEAVCSILQVSDKPYDPLSDKDTLPDGGHRLLTETELQIRMQKFIGEQYARMQRQ
ncbi:ADP-ribosylglycohydrolase-domain-containing protein [Globomyces pollinis-pini]|nr:ADP-ribosylglycohydrolase-domain-containing protein [Globomyces pollinis-pini]